MRTLTNYQFQAKVKDVHGTFLKPIQKYVTTRYRIKFRCKNNHVWKATPRNILMGRGCPLCAIKNQYISETEFRERVHRMTKGKIKPLEKYIHSETPIQFMCSKGHEFIRPPSYIQEGHSCPKCSRTYRYSHEEFLQKLKKVNRDIVPLEKYRINTEKILFQCPKGHQWRTTPYHVLHGSGCPFCCCNGFSYSAVNWLKKLSRKKGIHIQHIKNGGEFRVPGTRYVVDGYCAETNTIYEFYGRYWHACPEDYKPNDLINIRGCKIRAKDIWAKDQKRESRIRELGYQLVIRWEMR